MFATAISTTGTVVALGILVLMAAGSVLHDISEAVQDRRYGTRS